MEPMEPRLRTTIERLRRVPAADPGARARLRRALAAERRARRSVQLTPTRALLAAAIVATLTSLIWAAALRLAGPGTPLADARSGTPVQFVFVAPDANSVTLAGDFNAWSATSTPLARGEGGLWSVIVPLEHGTFAYSFVVNGTEWRADPAAPASPDDFGRPSSVVYVEPET